MPTRQISHIYLSYPLSHRLDVYVQKLTDAVNLGSGCTVVTGGLLGMSI